VLILVLSVIALSACETSSKVDLDDLERENRQILRQLGGE